MWGQTTFRFPASAVTRLESIRRLSHEAEPGGVVLAALHLYNDLLDLARANFELLVRDHDGRGWPFSPYERFEYPGLAEARDAQEPRDKSRPKNFIVTAATVAEIDEVKAKGSLNSRTDT